MTPFPPPPPGTPRPIVWIYEHRPTQWRRSTWYWVGMVHMWLLQLGFEHPQIAATVTWWLLATLLALGALFFSWIWWPEIKRRLSRKDA